MKIKYNNVLGKLLIILVFSNLIFGCSNSKNSDKVESFSSGTNYDKINQTEVYYENDDLLDNKITDQNQKIKKTDPQKPKEEEKIEKIEQKLIKTGNIECELENYKKSKAEINYEIKKWGGYISDEKEYNTDWQISNNMQIRVPVEKFDSLVANLIKGNKIIKSKQISVKDVTAQYVDVYSRLKNKKKEEEQYLKILTKAYTIQDILEVNNYIYAIREEIEASEGTLKYLDDQASFSTIYLNIYQNFEVEQERSKFGFFDKIFKGLETGWYGFLAFLVGLTYIWPILLIMIMIAFIIYIKVKKNKLKK